MYLILLFFSFLLIDKPFIKNDNNRTWSKNEAKAYLNAKYSVTLFV